MNCKVCGNTSAKNTTVSFFRFPKESTKCKEWAKRCGLLALFEEHGTSRFYKSFRVCSDHFDRKDVVFDGRKKRLLQSAVPKVLLSGKSSGGGKPGVVKNFVESKFFKLNLVENLCRLCAEENKNLTDIFGWRGRLLKLKDKLKYLPLVINEYDALPLRVCCLCVSKVNQFHDFILSCMKAETKLRILCDLKECDMSYKLIESNDKCQEKVDFIHKTPNVDMPDSSVMVTNCLEGTTENDFSDQSCQDNFINKLGENYLWKESQPNFDKTNQLTNPTNFLRESDFSLNNFRHDYLSNILSRNQIQNEDKKQAEIDQGVPDETCRNSCDIFLKLFPNIDEPNARSVTNSVKSSNLNAALFWDPSQSVFYTRSYEIYSKSDEKTHLRCFLKCDQKTSNIFCDLNRKNPKSKAKFSRCQFCDKWFKNRQLCLAHEKTHAGKTPYQCTQCNKGFRSRASLRQHRSVHSDTRVHRCQECGMSFKRKETLSNHLRTHTGERPFVCKVCGFAFKQRGDCVKHEKNHQKTSAPEIKASEVVG